MDEKARKSYNDVEAVDILHHVSNFYISTKVPHDYGTGEAYTSVEVHTLKHIADHHGIHGSHKGSENLFADQGEHQGNQLPVGIEMGLFGRSPDGVFHKMSPSFH